GQLVQLGGYGGFEARRRAELLRQVAHLRAAQQNIERAVGAGAWARQQVLDHGLLCRRHLIVTERLEPVAAQAEGAGVGALRVGGLSGGDSDEGERGGAGNQASNHDVLLSASTNVVARERALIADVEPPAAHHGMRPAGQALVGDPEPPLFLVALPIRLGASTY